MITKTYDYFFLSFFVRVSRFSNTQSDFQFRRSFLFFSAFVISGIIVHKIDHRFLGRYKVGELSVLMIEGGHVKKLVFSICA